MPLPPRTDPLVRRWTVVGDAVLHSRETPDAGHPGTYPVVFLHGVATTSRYARPLLRTLAGSVTAAAVELPGIGSSDAPQPPDGIDGQADLVAAWLRATRRWPALVVGNSMGSQTAVELAVRHPGLVGGLVLLGPTVDAARRGLFRQAWRLVVDGTRERPSMLAIAATDSFLTRRLTVLGYLRASLAHHIEERVGGVAAPVLVVRGERDPMVSRGWVRELASRARDGRWVEIAGAAHACHHGRPDAVAELVLGVHRRTARGVAPPP